MNLLDRRHWIFDMDGTLTVAIHDFDGLRARLGLPSGAPILETCEAHPDSNRLLAEIDRWEEELAEEATAAPGVRTLLDWLSGRATLGVLTRNTRSTALRTLEVAGLAEYFDPAAVLGRDQAAAKPDPAGIELLLARWGAEGSDAVMVGDYLFDLQAGRAAGTATVWIDRIGGREFHEWADIRVSNLAHLVGSP